MAAPPLDPVWAAALDAHPRARAFIDESLPEGLGRAPVPLFYRLGDLLRSLNPPPPSPEMGGVDPVDSFLVDLFGAYLDRPSWSALRLVEAIDARLALRDSGFPQAFAGWDAAAGCAPWRDPGALYLVVVRPPANPDAPRVARVSIYRVERHDDDDGDDGISLASPATVAQYSVSADDSDVEFFAYREDDGADHASADEARAAAEQGIDGLAGALRYFAQMLAHDAVLGPAATTDDDDGESAADFVGTLMVSRALVPLLAASPRLAQEVMAQAAFDNRFLARFDADDEVDDAPLPSLVGTRAALLDECALALALRLMGASVAARELEALVRAPADSDTLDAPRSLANLAVAAVSRASVPHGARPLSALPNGIRERAALSTWQSVCSAGPDSITGRLARADRLIDVAQAIGVEPTAEQAEHPERLCPDLLDAVVRAGVAAAYGAAPVTPRIAPVRYPPDIPSALELVSHTWGDSTGWSEGDMVDKEAWALTCDIGPDRRLTADEVHALLLAVGRDPETDAVGAAIYDAAVAAETSDSPLVFGDDRDGDDDQDGDGGSDRSSQRQRIDRHEDTADRIQPLVDLADRAFALGAVVDPMDIVYPGRLCARMALYRILDPF